MPALFGCAGDPAPSPGAVAQGVAPARELMRAGALTIDVRSQGEWDAGHLPQARHVPVDEVPARADEIAGWLGGDRTKPVVVYCRSGARSERARRALVQAGFTHVVNGGGWTDLRD